MVSRKLLSVFDGNVFIIKQYSNRFCHCTSSFFMKYLYLLFDNKINLTIIPLSKRTRQLICLEKNFHNRKRLSAKCLNLSFMGLFFHKIVLQFRSSCLIQDKSHVWMMLQDTSWYLLCYWPLDHLENGICLLVTIGKQDNLLSSHNRSNSH